MPMKKIILSTFASILFLQQAYSQSFTVITQDTVLVETDPFALAEAHAQVKNNTNQAIRTIVRRDIITMHPEHVNYFCWGVNCYAPTTTQSPDTLLVDPQAINSTFKGYIDAGGVEGISEVRYSFINASNPTDQVSFRVKYYMGVESVGGGKEPGQPVAVPASYDPYTQTIKVNVSSGKIEVWNMIGQKVELVWKYDGNGMVADASRLKPGYYFLFGNGDNRLWSARVIVSK